MNIPTSCVIETHGLTKTYKGIQALKALDLKVARNSICGFLDQLWKLNFTVLSVDRVE